MAALLMALALATQPPPLPPTDPAGWRSLAARDLDGMREALRANSPIFAVDRDSAPLRRWAEIGYAEATHDLPLVHDAASALALLARYAGGFRDGHIRLETVGNMPDRTIRWPGFTLRWAGSAYRVDVRRSAAGSPAPPPKGARLIGCDGHSAEQLARTRLDRVQGDLDRNGRLQSAPAFTLDLGNPYAGGDLRRCRFAIGAKTVAAQLTYRPIGVDEMFGLFKGRVRVRSPFGLTRVGDSWWIGLPDFGEHDWPGLLADIRRRLPELRASKVVLDLRDNGGGNSAFADQLARALYGDSLVSARAPHLGAIVYRASPANRATYADFLAQLKAHNEGAGDIAEVAALVDKFDQAIAASQPTFRIASGSAPSAARTTPAPANPFRHSVVLLTDGMCFSACLDAMDLFTALPGTVHAGTRTSADTIFMDLSSAPLPSGLFAISYGHKAWIDRPRGSNVAFTPAATWTYHGDIGDDAAWRRWLTAKLARR